MNKLNYAVAMLTAAGGTAALTTSAQAATLYGTFSGVGYSETFDIQTTGATDSNAKYTDFVLTNDSMGNTAAQVGNQTTGFKATFGGGSDSIIATGSIGPTGFTTSIFDSLAPALYNSTDITPVLQAGTYVSDIPTGTPFGGGLTLTLSAIPEPEAWALLIAGAALTGGAVRASRRRRFVVA